MSEPFDYIPVTLKVSTPDDLREIIAVKDAEIAALQKAMVPFATFGYVDERNPLAGEDIRDGLMCDRICDWFGPSDFDAARSALEMSGGVK
jgi:hypothetical protein